MACQLNDVKPNLNHVRRRNSFIFANEYCVEKGMRNLLYGVFSALPREREHCPVSCVRWKCSCCWTSYAHTNVYLLFLVRPRLKHSLARDGAQAHHPPSINYSRVVRCRLIYETVRERTGAGNKPINKNYDVLGSGTDMKTY